MNEHMAEVKRLAEEIADIYRRLDAIEDEIKPRVRLQDNRFFPTKGPDGRKRLGD